MMEVQQVKTMTENFTNVDFERIGEYLIQKYPILTTDWNLHRPDISLVERIVRVEEELKNQRELMKQGFDNQRELMKQGFDMMDKRFEEMQTNTNKRFEEMQTNTDKRFEDMNKKFSMMMWVIGVGFTVLMLTTTLMPMLVPIFRRL
jgi:DNA anti-recombination protein RmuC